MTKTEKYYQEIIRGINDGYVILKCPVAFHKGKMVLFAECDNNEQGHKFGGQLPIIKNSPPNSRLQCVLSISTSSCDLFRDMAPGSMPLIFPFQHDGGTIKYTVQNDSTITLNTLNPAEYTDNWPYENYPEYFGERFLCCSETFDISESKFEKILPQGLWKEDSAEMVIIVPPSNEYGVSLWGPMGDDEGVLCVFYINQKNRTVRAGNQCS